MSSLLTRKLYSCARNLQEFTRNLQLCARKLQIRAGNLPTCKRHTCILYCTILCSLRVCTSHDWKREISKNGGNFWLNPLESWQETCTNRHRFYLSKFLVQETCYDVYSLQYIDLYTRCILMRKKLPICTIFLSTFSRIFNDCARIFNDCAGIFNDFARIFYDFARYLQQVLFSCSKLIFLDKKLVRFSCRCDRALRLLAY